MFKIFIHRVQPNISYKKCFTYILNLCLNNFLKGAYPFFFLFWYEIWKMAYITDQLFFMKKRDQNWGIWAKESSYIFVEYEQRILVVCSTPIYRLLCLSMFTIVCYHRNLSMFPLEKIHLKIKQKISSINTKSCIQHYVSMKTSYERQMVLEYFVWQSIRRPLLNSSFLFTWKQNILPTYIFLQFWLLE